jgi:hypothetical protein
MENTDLIKNKNRILIFGLAYILLTAQSFSVTYASQPQFPDNFKVSEYFSFFGSGGIDWRALNDTGNNPILVACIKGITNESLKSLGIPDVQQRLDRLERGNLVKKVDGRYVLAFPAIVGDKRDLLRKYAEQAAQQMVPSAEKMIVRIRANLDGRDEMLYHVLWSVIMDGGQAWGEARTEMNKKIDVGDTSIQNKAWLLYPSHPFRTGTNSGNNSFGHLKVTWSRNTPSPNAISRVISQYSAQLIQAIEQDGAVESVDAKNALDKYGLLDESGKVRLYTIKADSEATKSYAELGAEFGRQIMTQLDAKKVADMLDVSPGVAFVIAYHEICWQLLQDLSEKKILLVPQIVAQAGTKTADAYQLVSLTTIKSVKDPLLKTKLSRQENEIPEYFEKTKNEILQGRKFSSQSTPADALLTLISAYHHQDRNTLEQIFPIVRQKQFERLLSPEVGAQMLAAVRKAIICRIEIENEPPKESDLCAIYSSQSPDKTIDQVWSFAYVKGAWRFAGSTSESDNWRAQAKQAEAMTRNILQSQAENTKAAVTNTPQQNANKIEGKWNATLPEFNQNYEIRFWRKTDGTLAGAATLNSPDDRPFDGVTFENSKLRFEEKVNQGVFEGTMKEDGLTIEGKLQKPGVLTPCVLNRIDEVQIEDKGNDDSEEVQGTPKQDESTGNQMLSLDGEGDCMRVADSQSLRSFTNAITIEVWLKASSFQAESGNINSIIRKNIMPNAENFLLRFRNVGGKPALEMGLGGEIGLLRATYDFALGTWYHIAGIYDGNTITVFMNGIAVESLNIPGKLSIDQSDLYIGKGDPTFSDGEYFHGKLDEIRVWNVARSQEQIQAAINTPLTGKEDGLVAYWNFDDGTAKDLSGHGNDGVLSGDARIAESPRPAISISGEKQPGKLIAWWRLDEADGNDVADSSGNNNAGRLVGNPQWQPEGGKIGGALEFDGDGDFVQIENESAFDITGPITVAAWIKVNSFDKRWQALVTKGDTAWRLQRYAEDNTLAFHCTGIKSVTGQRPEGIEGKKNVNDGQWHHAVGVYDGVNISLYIDGELDNSSTASGTIQTNNSAVIIGGNSEQADREWNGMIDEVCIIAGSIDADAVQALYTGADPNMIAQKANPQLQGLSKLIAWWKFENDTNDSAGFNNGTIYGNPTFVDGKFGRAICFDGNDYIDCGNPDSLDFGTGDWTISAWIKTTQTGTDQQDEALLNRGTVIANGGDEAGGIRYALAVNEGQLGSITLTTDNDTSKVQAVSRTAVNDGAWHHIVGMRNAEQLYIYVDGVLDGGSYLPAGYDLSGTSQHNAYIGVITDNRDNSLYKYFVGAVDEVCIFNGAIDANGVSALYSGEDPAKVAQTLIIARSSTKPAIRKGVTPLAGGSIEGDWRIVSNQVNPPAIIQIRKESDGALAATIVAENPDETSPTIPLDEVTFENGTLRFKVISNQGQFEGTMKEDSQTIEGRFEQQGQITALNLQRIVAKPSEAIPVAQEQLHDSTSGKSNIAVALILILALAGVVGAIVFFLVKSSIR